VVEALDLTTMLRDAVRASREPLAPPSPRAASRIVDAAIDHLVRDPAQRQMLLEIQDAERRALLLREIVRGERDRESLRRMN
jgi:hypothetical protein